MANLKGMLRLIAETESALTRETETILAGKNTTMAETNRKTELSARLVEQAPSIGHLAYGASADEQRQLRDGFERMLSAAARNELVLRGALRGARLVASALREASEQYGASAYSNGATPAAAPSAAHTKGHYDRLA